MGYHRIRKIGRVYEFIIHLIFGDKMKSYSSHFKSILRILSTLYRFHQLQSPARACFNIEAKPSTINCHCDSQRKLKKLHSSFKKRKQRAHACAVTRPAVTPSLYPCVEPQGGAESIGSQQVVVRQVSYGNIMEISKLCKIL